MAISKIASVNTGGGFRIQVDAGKDGSLAVLSTQANNFLSKIDANGLVTTLAPTTSFGNFASGYVETLSDGRYVLYTTSHFGLGWDARVQILGANGSPATGVIDPGFENGQTNTLSGYVLAPTTDGGFVFAFTDISRGNEASIITFAPVNGHTQHNAGVGRDVRVRFFDENGVGGSSTVADDDVESLLGATASRRASDQFIHDAAVLTGGQTVFTFVDQRWVGNPGGGAHAEYQLSMQIATPGNIGEPVKIDLGPFGNQFGEYPETLNNVAGANVVPLPNGTFAVIWTEEVYKPAAVWGNYAFDGWSTVIRYFSASGEALTDQMEIVRRGTPHGNHSKYVWGEALPDGRIVIAFNTGVDGVNGNGSLDAFLGVLGPLGSSIEISRVNPDAALNTQVYTIQDLAVRSDGTIDLVYNNAAKGENGFNINHTLIDRFSLGQAAGEDDGIFSGKRTDYLIERQSDGSLKVTDMREGSPEGIRTVDQDTLQFTDGTRTVEQLVGANSTPVSDGKQGYSAGRGLADELVASNGDGDGTQLRGGGGNDYMQGGAYADFLIGNGGDDTMAGGGGGDQFRFFGNEIEGAQDRDTIYDLNFGEGDRLVFGSFADGTFAKTSTLNGFSNGSAAIIDSWQDILDADAASNRISVARASSISNDLVLRVEVGGKVQEIVISGGWVPYSALLDPGL